MANVSRILKRFETDFEDRISRKTGWGKGELMVEFRQAIIAALEEELERDRHPEGPMSNTSEP